MILVFQNSEFYDALREEKVQLSAASNKMIDCVLEFIKKKAVANRKARYTLFTNDDKKGTNGRNLCEMRIVCRE